MCWTDTSGSGTIANESLADHITSNTTILINAQNSSPRDEEIVLYSESSRPGLSSAVLGTTMFRHSLDSHSTFMRYIEDPHNGTQIGYLLRERPVFDPNTNFESLEQDSLLAGIPESLRSTVDPASILPLSNKSCGDAPTRCLVVVASADVFYFGPDPTNTACLSTITRPPLVPTPPQVAMNPSSIYVVYQPPQLLNECREMLAGIDSHPVTMIYQSEMISTLEYRSDGPLATKAMDFADLPCPPTEVANVYKPGAPYFPILHSTFGATWNILEETPDGKVVAIPDCDIAAVRDPSIHAYRVGTISEAENDNEENL